MRIPFNKPFIVGKELEYIADAVQGGQLAGDGRYTRRCQQWIEAQYGTEKALLTHSCTGALEMVALLCGVEEGDEVIMPSYTFPSTANAFVLRGAVPRFVDIRADTLNMDESLIEAAINERTRVIVPVHYAGVACEMDTIMAIAERHDLLVVEDAAQGVGSAYKGRSLGAIGHLGAYSFHETKNLISGEGGALLINDERFIERAEVIWQKGTNRQQFERGEVAKYSWVDIGSSFLPSELISAFLFAQLEHADAITQRRVAFCRRYEELLSPLVSAGDLRLPFHPGECDVNGHMFYVLVKDASTREGLVSHMRKAGVMAIPHYVPLHLSKMGTRFGYTASDLPVTEALADRVVRLPLYHDLSSENQERVASVLAQFFDVRGSD